MSSITKPTQPKGVRDFPPEVMYRRLHILSVIRETFEKFGFQPLETPSLELLEVLTGKYGDEGDQLLFKILRSGDFLSKTSHEDYEKGASHLLRKISEKGLRYDLTVPFARFVTKNRGVLTFPFKRYQMQPVWRADRPQKGRYQEFWQCDADVIGTDSLICEAEVLAMMTEVFDQLKLPDYRISINHRKILSGVATVIGAPEKESSLCIAIDKLDKIGQEKVLEELGKHGFSQASQDKLVPFLAMNVASPTFINDLEEWLSTSEAGLKGLAEIREIKSIAEAMGVDLTKITLDTKLARGLTYYTGAIFEVKVAQASVGSISGGGRYDDLTGVFGHEGLSGAGFSFGVDRIYDVMEEMNLFGEFPNMSTQIMFAPMDQGALTYCLPIISELRKAGIKTEIYPEIQKMKKQLGYADKKGIGLVAIVGESEVENQKLTIKNMVSGKQESINTQDVVKHLKELTQS